MKRIIGLILAVATVFCFCGCNAAGNAEKAVSGMMDAFKALDFETAGKYVDLSEFKVGDSDNATTESGKQVMGLLFDKLDYEILSSEEIDESTVNVSVKITAVDMRTVISEYAAASLEYAFSYAFSDEQPSDEEIMQKNEQLFAESVDMHKDERVTNEVVITVAKAEDAWKVQGSDALYDAVFGGLRRAVEDLENSFNNIGAEE